jgi:hypothetical protein
MMISPGFAAEDVHVVAPERKLRKRKFLSCAECYRRKQKVSYLLSVAGYVGGN